MATTLMALEMDNFEDMPAFETWATRFAAFCAGVPLAVTCIVLASVYDCPSEEAINTHMLTMGVVGLAYTLVAVVRPPQDDMPTAQLLFNATLGAFFFGWTLFGMLLYWDCDDCDRDIFYVSNDSSVPPASRGSQRGCDQPLFTFGRGYTTFLMVIFGATPVAILCVLGFVGIYHVCAGREELYDDGETDEIGKAAAEYTRAEREDLKALDATFAAQTADLEWSSEA